MPLCCGAAATSTAWAFVVHDAPAPGMPGRIMCVPPTSCATAPRVAWRCASDPRVGEAALGLDASRLTASSVPAGRYVVRIDDDDGPHEHALAVATLGVPTVVAYAARQPSSPLAHDGVVEARVEHCPRGTRFLWSNGAVTDEPALHHAPSGTYTITPLGVAAFVSACAPCHLSADLNAL